MPDSLPSAGFAALELPVPILRALDQVGYETPTPIQLQSIPPLLQGRDLLGEAHTGTGKTAAFALPLLARLDLAVSAPQLLVLTPTRELAIQVAEACATYARYLPGLRVLPLYGGKDYGSQLQALRRGVQVVVGTPGRIMDHLRRGTLRLAALQTPPERQIALFSATMPEAIRRVARRHLQDPVEVRIAATTTTAATIRQRYWRVSGLHKLDALTRLLEVEDFDAVLVFVRTKTATVELAQQLVARGHSCEALNGDVPQSQRERIVERLRNGQLDIVIATDVAARGLDVERVSHVVNYDVPTDPEAYVHRIGRTGRAGRSGEAILFIAPREERLLRAIERATRQPIEPLPIPTAADVNRQRIARFKQRISAALAEDLELYEQLIGEYEQEHGIAPRRIAAALARLAQGDRPLLLPEREPAPSPRTRPGKAGGATQSARPGASAVPRPLRDFPDLPMQRFRLEVGHRHGAKPGNIVGAIANEAELDGRYIGHIEIFADFSLVDLPRGMPKDVMRLLQKARVCGRQLGLRPLAGAAKADSRRLGRSRAVRA